LNNLIGLRANGARDLEDEVGCNNSLIDEGNKFFTQMFAIKQIEQHFFFYEKIYFKLDILV
jgi:hypothetical protein